jgi:hypothetical protein
MITIENRVGRLIETRLVSPLLDTEFSHFQQERERLMRSVGQDRVVCIDLSRVQILPPTQADAFLNLLRGSRPGLTRNAFLLPPNQAVLALQFSRIIRQANNPARRAFQSRAALITWLAEILRPPELLRLESFLDGEPSGA